MNQKKKLLEGIVKRHPDGFGFFIPDNKEHPDVYIPRHSMNEVMSNDRVSIVVEKERGNDRFRGEIVRILSRSLKQVVGVFQPINEDWASLKDEGKAWGQDLRIKMENSLNAKPGELVAAEILQYPSEKGTLQGRVKEIIGDAADPINDIRRVIYAHHIPHEFPDTVLAEAARIPEEPEPKDFQNRQDLRDKNLITIDGATAKDFDDAVLVEKHAQGFKLYVAIADVSHYVQSGTAIDQEAYQRGTSVYFPNFVVPMLPEALSNGLCSLNPRVPRLCVVAEMMFDYNGEKISSKFYEAVMESKARVTYGIAQELIDGVEQPQLSHVKENILLCADLAKILMSKRFREGSLDLEIPETELEIDASGVPVDVIRSERLFAHRLIEELMLAANVAVAEFLSSKDIPALYRIHEPPNEMALKTLERYLWNFGSRTKITASDKLQRRLTQALEEFSDRPESQILHILTLRSMSQAKYNMNNVGHFGLGFENYTHFTSPIRRYPDLIVHRLLKSQILKNSRYRLISESDLISAGVLLSACEQRAAKAERQLQSIKKARFMEKMVGKEFSGLISSVTKFGIFVLLREYDIDGLLRLSDLGEKFEFDEENLRLVAKRSGFSYNIGDFVNIVVSSADHNAGQVNFVLAESAEQTQRPGSEKQRNSSSLPLKKSAKKFGKKPVQKSRDTDWKKSKEDRPFRKKGEKKKNNNTNNNDHTHSRPDKKLSRKLRYLDEKENETRELPPKLDFTPKQSIRFGVSQNSSFKLKLSTSYKSSGGSKTNSKSQSKENLRESENKTQSSRKHAQKRR